ncbi:MAG: hypothetical protein AB7O56_13365 [Bauldia sp.]
MHDIDAIARRLEEAEARVARGRKIIEEQVARLAELKRDGHDTELAEDVLRTLRESQEIYESALKRTEAEIDLAMRRRIEERRQELASEVPGRVGPDAKEPGD